MPSVSLAEWQSSILAWSHLFLISLGLSVYFIITYISWSCHSSSLSLWLQKYLTVSVFILLRAQKQYPFSWISCSFSSSISSIDWSRYSPILVNMILSRDGITGTLSFWSEILIKPNEYSPYLSLLLNIPLCNLLWLSLYLSHIFSLSSLLSSNNSPAVFPKWSRNTVSNCFIICALFSLKFLPLLCSRLNFFLK